MTNGEGPGSGARLLIRHSTFDIRHSLRQAASFDQLHRIKVAAAFLPDFKDRHDVGVVELRGGFRFSPEPAHFLFCC
jgi:hypothetical protein